MDSKQINELLHEFKNKEILCKLQLLECITHEEHRKLEIKLKAIRGVIMSLHNYSYVTNYTNFYNIITKKNI